MMLFVTAWVDLEDIMLSELQKKIYICRMISFYMQDKKKQ